MEEQQVVLSLSTKQVATIIGCLQSLEGLFRQYQKEQANDLAVIIEDIYEQLANEEAKKITKEIVNKLREKNINTT